MQNERIGGHQFFSGERQLWGAILLAWPLPARFVLKVCCHVSSHCFPHSHWSPSGPKAWRSFSEELGVETVWGDQSLCEILASKFTWDVFCRVFSIGISMKIIASKLLAIREASWIKTPNACKPSKFAVNCHWSIPESNWVGGHCSRQIW